MPRAAQRPPGNGPAASPLFTYHSQSQAPRGYPIPALLPWRPLSSPCTHLPILAAASSLPRAPNYRGPRLPAGAAGAPDQAGEMVQLNAAIELVPRAPGWLLPCALIVLGVLTITCDAVISPDSTVSFGDIGAAGHTITANVDSIGEEQAIASEMLPPGERCAAAPTCPSTRAPSSTASRRTPPGATDAAVEVFECVSPAYPHAVAAGCSPLLPCRVADWNA
eukprot:COSAG04_NODE_827_length_10036_cov_6.659455_13_plen_222_part_00